MTKLIIRKKGNYYQLGFNYNKRWHNIKHLGTPAKLLKELGITISEEYQRILNKTPGKNAK